MVQAMICDFDFTLADSSPGVVACVNEALAGLGLPPASADRIHATIGLSLPHSTQLPRECIALAQSASDVWVV